MSMRRLVFKGDLSEWAVLEMIAIAESRGFTLEIDSSAQPVVEPPVLTLEELDRIELSPKIALPLQFRNMTAADLTRWKFADFKETSFHENTCLNGGIKGDILDFMVLNRVGFSDFSPASELKTRIDKHLFSVRIYNALRLHGVRWLELLKFYSGSELRDMRNFGRGSEKVVIAVLEARGIKLKGE